MGGDKVKRQVAIEVSVEFFQHICTVGWCCGEGDHVFKCASGLPDGAKFISAQYKSWDGSSVPTLVLVFEHESFDVTLPGKKIPTLEIVHVKLVRELVQ